MGIDVYLSWDGMTEGERDARDSEWLGLEAGNRGYLRAAWWMKREVRLLGDIFPDRYWVDESPEPVPYDFKVMLAELDKAALSYRRSVEGDERSCGGEVKELLDKAPRDAGFIQYPFDGLVADDAEAWLRTVFDFFKLGIQKQEEGKDPKVHVL